MMAGLLMPTTNYAVKPFYRWVSLYIDGVQISNSTQEYGCACTPTLEYPLDLDIGGIRSFSWAPHLAVGNHIAKIVIAIPGVEPLEYEWHFRIK
jgi:hypothetical protein